MTKTPVISQKNLQCKNCAGQCVYAPNTGTLTCESCATEHEIQIDPNADPTAEQHYDPDLPHTEQPKFTQDRPYRCETCGGEVIFLGHSISENCTYCNGALVSCPNDESYPTLGMVPFSVAQDQAQLHTLEWVSKRWAAPSGISQIIAKSRVSGIYVPFWTFDSHEAVKYTVSYRVRRGDDTYNYTHSGDMKTMFDDMLVPASKHVTPLIRDGILHDFEPDSLRPFEPSYLAGFAAERHHQTVRDGLRLNAPDKKLLLRNRIKKHSGKSGIYKVSYVTDTTGMRYRRILLPVWILHYEYNGKPMKVVTCGLHGRTFGERPFSTLKLLGYSALAACAVSTFGFFWGMNNFY